MYFWCVSYYKFFLFLCVYRILCRFLYIWRYVKGIFDIFWKMFQKCEQFSYELLFFLFFPGFVFLNGPPTPIPGVNVSSLLGEKHMGENLFFSDFYDFYENKKKRRKKNGSKMIKSCSIRRYIFPKHSLLLGFSRLIRPSRGERPCST